MSGDRHPHWQNVYTSKGEDEVSWFKASPSPSLELIGLTGAKRDAAIVDIGGGAARLVDALLDAGYADLSCSIVRKLRLQRAQHSGSRSARSVPADAEG